MDGTVEACVRDFKALGLCTELDEKVNKPTNISNVSIDDEPKFEPEEVKISDSKKATYDL